MRAVPQIAGISTLTRQMKELSLSEVKDLGVMQTDTQWDAAPGLLSLMVVVIPVTPD